MILHVISYVITCRDQDCVALLAPYPNNPNPVESFNVKTDFDLTGDGLVWYARRASTLLQLHLVSDRRQGVSVQRFAQGGVPGVFQHV
jgi:hypothetical protein